ncbi:MAG: hypothetical protein HY749_16355 [Gammaproteobacteria bacterium]|nr:hypothetical protein [Gammaproteobacteria bacterium]
MSSGKFYFEFVVDQAGAGSPEWYAGIDDGTLNLANVLGSTAGGYGIRGWTGQKIHNGSTTAYGSAFATGDVVGVAVDFSAGAIWFSKNGTWFNSATISEIQAGTTTHAAYTGISGSFTPAWSANDSTTAPKTTLRTEAAQLTGSVPSGFTAGWPLPTHGDGAAGIPVAAAGTGNVQPVHVTGGAGVPLAIVATGYVLPIHGDAALTVPLAPSGTASLPGKGQGAVTLMPSLVATGAVSRAGSTDAAMEGPEALLFGVISIGGTVDAALGVLGAACEATIPVTGGIDAELGALEAEASGVVTVVGVISTALGALEPALVGYVPITGTLATELAVLGAYLVADCGDSETWRVVVMNLKHGGISEYESYPMNSIVEWNGTYYGADDSGIYTLAGEFDVAADIDAVIRTARHDFGTDITKRVSDVYVQCKSAKKLVLRMRDGDRIWEYPVPSDAYPGFESVKVDTGRGLRVRYHEFELANFEGADFETDGFDLVITPIERRRKR